jgi:UDP-glucose 4-epimerase
MRKALQASVATASQNGAAPQLQPYRSRGHRDAICAVRLHGQVRTLTRSLEAQAEEMTRPHLARVLVTGATGTLGYNIVNRLAAMHPQTRIQVLLRKPDLELFSSLPNVGQQKVDMSEMERFSEAVMDFHPNAIIHCAASGVRPCNISWFDVIDLNVSATVQLFRASCEIPDCHFINISTGLVYDSQDRPCREGDPIHTLHPYGASKAASDCLLLAGADRLRRQLTVIRPFSFTGLHDGGNRLFPSLLQSALVGQDFSMSPGTQLRDFCAVQDVAEAVCMLLETGTPSSRSIFNVGSGRSVPLKEIVLDVIEQLGISVRLHCGSLPFHPHEPMHLVADICRMRELGWQPRTNLAYAVWQLAQTQFPGLQVQRPEQFL